MAGMSSSFFKAGYDKPKFMLEAKGITLFERSLLSFETYFKIEKFVFIIKNEDYIERFVECKVKKLGIKDYKIIYQLIKILDLIICFYENLTIKYQYMFNIEKNIHF